MSATEAQKRSLVVAGVLLIVLLIVTKAACHIVPAGNRGVVFSSIGGVKQHTLHEGFNLIVPFLDHVTNYEVRTQTIVFSKREMGRADYIADPIMGKTRDAQAVYVDLTLRFHPNPEQLPTLHSELTKDYVKTIIPVRTDSVTREIIAAYKAEEVFATRREEIEQQITKALAEVFAANYIVLDEALIRNVEFTAEYQKKIEQKQIALQHAEMKQYELQLAEKEKTRKTIEAKADAEAIRIRGESLAKYPSVVQYDYVQKIPAGTDTYVITGQTIVNMSDLFSKPKPAK
jgi:regulator of protease activity HflC (stomatin/prohibitin superfamily)